MHQRIGGGIAYPIQEESLPVLDGVVLTIWRRVLIQWKRDFNVV